MASSISPEKKLQLIKRIRSRQDQNLHLLRDREHLLYGKPLLAYDAYPKEDPDDYGSGFSRPVSTFSLRAIIALFLFGVFYLVNQNPERFTQIDAKRVYTVIEEDYSANVFDFINQISYTLRE